MWEAELLPIAVMFGMFIGVFFNKGLLVAVTTGAAVFYFFAPHLAIHLAAMTAFMWITYAIKTPRMRYGKCIRGRPRRSR